MNSENLQKKSFGKSIYKIWYPAGGFFSFFDLYFDTRQDAQPDVFGSWYIAQDVKRRYVFTLPDFQLLCSEIQYVYQNKESVSECELVDSFESTALKSITTWDAPLRARIYYEDDSIVIEFTNHPGASGKFLVASPGLIERFTKAVLQTWLNHIPALYLQETGFLPLGGAFSVFDDTEEHAVLSNSETIELTEYLANITENPEGKRISAILAISIFDTHVLLKIGKKEIELSFRELESLKSFLELRLFLKENGDFVKWRDKAISDYRTHGISRL